MNEHSTDDIRRKLAEFTGWRIETLNNPSGDYWGYAVYCNDRVKVPLKISSSTLPPSMSYIWKRAFKEADIPNWPNDVDAALALCLEIGFTHDYYLIPDKLDEDCYKAEFRTTAWKASGDPVWQLREGLSAYGTTAVEALARLALAWYEREARENE